MSQVKKENILPEVLNETTMADKVLSKLANYQQRREINLPKDYSPQNALKSAWLTILETQDKNKKPALDVCSKESIANALLKMVIQGLSPAKAQCYFIVHGNALVLRRSYQGTKAVAKRVAGIKDVLPGIVYEGDVFEYEYDTEAGRQKITKHIQKLENINPEKIVAAYAVVIEFDRSKKLEIMTIEQIRKAWQQGYPGDSHKNFPDQMAKKTVTYRACKDYIYSSDDADLFQAGDNEDDNIADVAFEEIKTNGNKEEVKLPEAPAAKPEKKKVEKNETPVVEPEPEDEANSQELKF